jgi:hypothetical protein
MLAETTVETFITSSTEVAPSIRSWKNNQSFFSIENNRVEITKTEKTYISYR